MDVTRLTMAGFLLRLTWVNVMIKIGSHNLYLYSYGLI